MDIQEVFLISIFVLAIGACIGSFLNVAALRSLTKESIVFPASKCPLCGKHIKWYDNIPVFSYFITIKGKCRNCGEKVSLQYPIVEFITALIFFIVFLYYGFTIKTLLLLILLSISIVITITDIKKNVIYDVHNWILIIMSIITGLYIKGINNYYDVAIGIITGVFVMEIIARASYYLVKKNKPSEDETVIEEKSENNNELQEKADGDSAENQDCKAENAEDEENIDINEYVAKNKRVFGEGDTYLAAASGALLGWKYFLAAAAIAIILQAVCILPSFLIGLFKNKHFKLLISLSCFTLFAVIYWILSNFFTLHLFVVFAIIIALLYFAVDSITELKKITDNQGFAAVPFGPALLFSTFLIFFFGSYILNFLKHNIFLIAG